MSKSKHNADQLQQSLNLVWRDPIYFIAFGFGSGLSPVMPGTCGTLVAVPFYLILRQLPLWLYGSIIVLGIVLGVYLCGKACEDFGVHDYPGVNWDEIPAFWLTMFMVPHDWYWIMIGFVLFRFFDIVKPWPINWLDKNLAGGIGIMLDDVVAAIFAWACLQGLYYFVLA